MAIGASPSSLAPSSSSSVSKTPLSITDLLARQKAEREAASKPRFLSKAERTAEAVKRREEEQEEANRRRDDERRQREELERRAEEEGRRGPMSGTGGQGMGQGRMGGYGHQAGYGNAQGGRYNNGQQFQNGHRQPAPPPNAPRGPGGARGQPPAGPRAYAPSPLSSSSGPSGQPPSGPRAMAPPPPPPSNGNSSGSGYASSSAQNGSSRPINGAASTDEPSDVVPPTAAELEAIRTRYLGASTIAAATPTGPKKPRARKLQDKKFVFDWDANDDTTKAEVGTWRDQLARGELEGQGHANGYGQGQGQGMQGAGKNGSGQGLHAPGSGVAGGGTTFGGRLAGYDEGGRRRGVTGGATDNHADSLERRRAGRHGIDDRHWTDKDLSEMKDRDWRIFREDFSISTKGGRIPNPLRSWRESAIPGTILDVIDEIGYTEPSPIQRAAIPIGLQNRDLVGIAQTGSGKTAAFVIPMLEYIGHLPPLSDDNRHLGPYALILAPTRELAQQIESECKRFSMPLGYKTVSIVGGRSVDEQQYALREGAEIIIATPGRLKDILDRSILVLSQCRYVVMDEADRMVDLGFELDLTFILDAMPADYIKPEGAIDLPDEDVKGKYRVTTLFSATMPPVVERLTKKYLRLAATVIIGNAGEAVDTVEQRVEFIQGDDKRKNRLQEILRTIGLAPPMIVFVNQKKTADMVVKYVQQVGRRATTLHSGKNQEQREAALASLRSGESEVLVATDLAGRGIDVPDVSCVINWQMASTIEKYVHRIGRTGRAGKQGIAITFLGNEDEEVMYDLKQEIAKSPISQMNPELAHHQAAKTRITREMKRKRDEEE